MDIFKKKMFVLLVLFAVVLIFSFFALSREENKNWPADQQGGQSRIILFYGEGCPHCAKVEEYIKQNQIENKISFAQKEVYYNKNNADEMAGKAKICGLPDGSIGVPFLWDGEKCLIGDQDIIDFFKQNKGE